MYVVSVYNIVNFYKYFLSSIFTLDDHAKMLKVYKSQGFCDQQIDSDISIFHKLVARIIILQHQVLGNSSDCHKQANTITETWMPINTGSCGKTDCTQIYNQAHNNSTVLFTMQEV
jgi:hypothetical protein